MEIIAATAARQHGVVNRLQCLAAGLTEHALQHRLETGSLIRVLPGVYRVAGAPRTWRQALMAALLWAGPGAVVSHRAAAAIWHAPGFEEGKVEIQAVRGFRRRSGIDCHRTRSLPAKDIAEIDSLRVTTPARTVVDLAAFVSRKVLEGALDDFLRRRLVTLEAVAEAMDVLGTKGRKGMAALKAALTVRFGQGGPSHSAMERRLYEVLVAAGLPRPRKQHKVWRNGKLFAQFDCAYVRAMIGIEADSYKWHGTRGDWDGDRARDRILRLMGWKVLRFSWEEIYFHPEYVVAEVRAALEERDIFPA